MILDELPQIKLRNGWPRAIKEHSRCKARWDVLHWRDCRWRLGNLRGRPNCDEIEIHGTQQSGQIATLSSLMMMMKGMINGVHYHFRLASVHNVKYTRKISTWVRPSFWLCCNFLQQTFRIGTTPLPLFPSKLLQKPQRNFLDQKWPPPPFQKFSKNSSRVV